MTVIPIGPGKFNVTDSNEGNRFTDKEGRQNMLWESVLGFFSTISYTFLYYGVDYVAKRMHFTKKKIIILQ